ncbi:uncharacterized protein LOC109810968 [Cajanus cajan]|uniref:Uncharacterized protein n=1 Tax=Cajanus cajan TaxID=3821 RepID=A0A151SCW6_CAJCA|nr:uncharacterized protein LOC109810968 [Cajanus cajan]KYP52626.1 hypothetical protein KK1_025366 [Cajanus cajan]
MGNCMETYTKGHAEERQKNEEEEERGRRWRGFVEKNDDKGVSMKVVLTKEELKWLILQLNEKGGMRVEEMVAEIERGREKVKGYSWKPSLERILEAPEMLQMEDITT